MRTITKGKVLKACLLATLLGGTAMVASTTDANAQMWTRTDTSVAGAPTGSPSVTTGSQSSEVCPVSTTESYDDVDAGDSGEPGDADGSGGTCLAAGTLIQMKDGSLKRVEDIRSGDETSFGKVLESYARSSDPRTLYTQDREFSLGHGLHEFRGVIGTGRHVIFDGKGWTEMQNSDETRHVNMPEMHTVYNLRMENYVIPVMNGQGELLLFADSINNIDGQSERTIQQLEDMYKQAA